MINYFAAMENDMELIKFYRYASFFNLSDFNKWPID